MSETQNLLPVILAGGSGTRLWPLSRKHYAKQYLALGGEKTMLQETVERLEDLPHLPPLLICNEDTRFLAAEQMRQIRRSDASILLEPAGRNTAPAIALGALEAVAGGDDPVLLVIGRSQDKQRGRVRQGCASGYGSGECWQTGNFWYHADAPRNRIRLHQGGSARWGRA